YLRGGRADGEERDRERDFPRYAHELVVAHARQRRPNPHECEEHDVGLDEEPEKWWQDRARPPAEEEHGGHGGDGEGIRVLGEEEERERHSAVLGVKAGHDL